MPRLFTAIEAPADIRPHLLDLQPYGDGVFPSTPENLHITLHFIGEVGDNDIDRLRSGLQQVRATSFRLALRGVGCFEVDDTPRFLWAGVEKTSHLMTLHAAIGNVLTRLQRSLEDREYRPHVTLARLESADTELIDSFVQQHAEFHIEFDVREFALYESRRERGKSRYVKTHTFSLTERK